MSAAFSPASVQFVTTVSAAEVSSIIVKMLGHAITHAAYRAADPRPGD